ncbi:glycine--tRNA ligase subunit beta [Candidatus Cytomitobacter primus]|uniref:glycine--tRNA ligase n=1 Tax=Candidatus Cytomitobacter primus TaxID=2066024 RepID=A0A5C0UHE2_9PROT|nr:glycine--tRNA ligase subunit beta [Candidatus Cytomitobacter primus]QEK38464.1 glycine--tRNA ligase subunit beta [Candidatus Cytomitobacter primus]
MNQPLPENQHPTIGNQLLFEIMHENIPHDIKKSSLEKWTIVIKEELQQYKINPDSLHIYITNTRLITVIDNLPNEIQKDTEIIRGPRSNIKQEILDKFLQKHNKIISDTYIENGFYYIKNEHAAQQIDSLISQICISCIQKMKWNKIMFWGRKLGWIRPIRRIVSVFNGSPLLWNIESLELSTSSNFIYDLIKHEEFTANNFAEYNDKLAKRNTHLTEKFSILQNVINMQLKDKASQISNAKLININSQIEAINVYHTKVDDKFNVPKEIKQSILNEQQHIGVFDGDLLTDLLIFSEHKLQNSNLLIEQTKRTLHAKFNDAYFFYTRDMQNDVTYYLSKLEQTLFYKGLGTLYQKIERITKVAQKFYNDAQLIIAIKFLQIDLCMQTIDEMSDLQGLLSYFYAKQNNINDVACKAILSQYKKNIDDVHSLYLTLLYNLDSVVAFIGKDIIPTGSSDPLAIRRKCLEIIDIMFKLQECGISIDLNQYVNYVNECFKEQNIHLDLSGFDKYFQKRCEYVLGKKYGDIAKFVSKERNILIAKDKLEQISNFNELNKIVETYNRLLGLDYTNVKNIDHANIGNISHTNSAKCELSDLLQQKCDLDNLLAISITIESIFTNTFLDDNLGIKYLIYKAKAYFEQFADFRKKAV